jgi:hypothetical protein
MPLFDVTGFATLWAPIWLALFEGWYDVATYRL